MTPDDRSPFDELLAGDRAEPAEKSILPPSRQRGILIGAGVSVTIGSLLLAGSALALARTDSSGAASAPASPRGAGEQAVSPVGEPTQRSAPASTASPQGLVDQEWMRERAATGIPPRALSAYAAAALAVSDEYPECGLGWNTLAGIGDVESHHGTIDGSILDDDGVASPPIVGIPLTGETTQAIRDTDDGALDGDTVWDRAVGPLQFIPGTWAEWASDGDGDGQSDPQDIDDAALASARYLCEVGGDLTDPSRWIAAIHAYNPTVEYNNRVAAAAERFGAE